MKINDLLEYITPVLNNIFDSKRYSYRIISYSFNGEDVKCGEYSIHTLDTYTKYETNIALFSIYPYNTSDKICVATNAITSYGYQRKGIGKALNDLSILIAKDLGFKLIICTDVSNNTPERKILDKNGWKHIFDFRNRRTNNMVTLSVKNLQEGK